MAAQTPHSPQTPHAPVAKSAPPTGKQRGSLNGLIPAPPRVGSYLLEATEPYQIQIDLRGHAYLSPEHYETVRAGAQVFVDLCTGLGMPLTGGFQPADPPPVDGGVEIPPVVTAVTPSSAVCGGPDVTLHVAGTGFTSSSVILFNGGQEATVYVGPTELTTLVKPSLATVAVTVAVSVVGASTSVDFAFTQPETRATTPRGPNP